MPSGHLMSSLYNRQDDACRHKCDVPYLPHARRRKVNTMRTPGPRKARPVKVSRTEAVRIRLTPDERAKIETRAEMAGLSFSEFVRLSAQMVEIRGRVEYRAIDALATAGENLNELTSLLRPLMTQDGSRSFYEIDRILTNIKAVVMAVHDKVAAL